MRMHLTSDFERLVDALAQPEAYPTPSGGQIGAVQVLETRLSVLFFAGERVYKLRKPVEQDRFVVEERRRACEEALRLDRRISPGMFLGVRPVTRDDDDRIAFDGSGEAIDWAVEMMRLPAEGMLDARLARGDIGNDELRLLATELVRFHERATTDPLVNEYGLSNAVSARVRESLERLERASPSEFLPRRAWSLLRQRIERFTEVQRDLLERRVAHWRIREGHGALRASRICIVGDAVFVFGCADRNPHLRCGDVMRDLAALAVDLDRRGQRERADELVRAYTRISSDEDLERLMGFYKIVRALMRAEEELSASEAPALDEASRGASSELARSCLALAVSYELPSV